MENCLRRLYDGNDGLFFGDVADFHLQPSTIGADCRLLQNAAKGGVNRGQRSSDSSSPILAGTDPTEKIGEVHKVADLDKQKSKLDEIRLNRLRENLDQLIEADPRLRALRPHLIINMVQEGLRIQIIDSQNRPMFKTGSAEVESYMRDILRAIAPILNQIPNRLSLAGHTDDFPYAGGNVVTVTGNFRRTALTLHAVNWLPGAEQWQDAAGGGDV